VASICWASAAVSIRSSIKGKFNLGLLLGLGLPELLIDRNRYAEDCVYDPLQEALHRREQLILQTGDLLLPIGVIDPAAPQGLAPVRRPSPCLICWLLTLTNNHRPTKP